MPRKGDGQDASGGLATALGLAGASAWRFRVATDEWTWLPASSAEMFPDAPDLAQVNSVQALLRAVVPEDRQTAEKAIRSSARDGTPLFVRFRVAGSSAPVWMGLKGGRAGDGAEGELAGILFRISDAEGREAELRRLMGSVHHWTKNLLMSIAAIASESARSEEQLGYVEGLRGRIRALSCVHELLHRSDWSGVDLRELVLDEINIITFEPPPNLTTSGPLVLLKPRAGQSLALALHELITNAAAFGALSDRGGQITVAWSSDGSGDAPLKFRWEETGFGEIQPGREQGFGTTVIKELLPLELDAEVDYTVADGRIHFELTLPREWVLQLGA